MFPALRERAVTAATRAALQTLPLSPVSRDYQPLQPPPQPEPLKLTITQSECLFGIIRPRGKVRDEGEEGSRLFSADRAR